MANASETAKTALTQTAQLSDPTTHGQGKSDCSPNIICDLADSEAFVETYRKPHTLAELLKKTGVVTGRF